jgi:hypothetical protein
VYNVNCTIYLTPKTDASGQNNLTMSDFEFDQWIGMSSSNASILPSGTGISMEERSAPLSGPFNSFIEMPDLIDWVSPPFISKH